MAQPDSDLAHTHQMERNMLTQMIRQTDAGRERERERAREREGMCVEKVIDCFGNQSYESA